jgi:hypothetical protein
MNYRLYFYDTANQISHIFPFDCINDTLAQSIAELHAQDTTYELWNRDRLVTRKQYALEDVEIPVGLRRRGYNI